MSSLFQHCQKTNTYLSLGDTVHETETEMFASVSPTVQPDCGQIKDKTVISMSPTDRHSTLSWP